MLQKVEVLDKNDNLIYTFGVMNQSDVDYILTTADGLDPVKTDFNLFEYALTDGASFDSARTGIRSLVLTLDYSPFSASTVEQLRRNLYFYMRPKAFVRLRFVFGNSIRDMYEIDGYVEDFEAPMFSDKPRAVLSISCMDPYFREMEDYVAYLNTDTSPNRTRLGTAETGFVLEIDANPSASFIDIQNGVDARFRWYGTLASGEKLVVSTIQGDKYISKVDASGKSRNALNGLTRGTLRMYIGGTREKLKVDAEGLPFTYKLTVRPKHVGL